jgi:tRNA threonylcarbamoyladenosine biosynthesis protein TsaB
MRVLAFDTSQIQAAVCLVEDGKLLHGLTGAMSVAHSEALLPLIDRLLKAAGVELGAIDAFAVGVGPGSFTGIRVGCATAKAFAQARRRPVGGFSSLRALSFSKDASGRAEAVVNAYQGQVFVGCFAPNGEWTEEAAPADAWRSQLSGTPQFVTPEGIARLIKGGLPFGSYLELHARYLRASAAEDKLAAAKR